MDLEGHRHKVYGCCGYRHNYEGFYEKTSYQMFINRGRKTTTQGAHASLAGILSFLLFLSWWRALKRRSNHPEIVWISLEARHLNSFKNSFKETMYVCFLIHTRWYDHLFLESWCFEYPTQYFPLHSMFKSKFWKFIDSRIKKKRFHMIF